MPLRYNRLYTCLSFGLCAACTQLSTSEQDAVGLTSQALSVCSETVPQNRNVDGIPAYAQCADSSNSPIFSNNGVDTATTQMGSDWVRTQWSGGYQCTEFAHRYLYFKWQVKWIPNGNAGFWCDTQPPANSGLEQTMSPVHGDIMVLAPGSCGADSMTGHVNVIDVVEGNKLIAVEQNGARRGNYQLSCAKCFLHVVENDGSGPAAPAGGAAGAKAAPSSPSATAGAASAQGAAGSGWGVAAAGSNAMRRGPAAGWPGAAGRPGSAISPTIPSAPVAAAAGARAAPTTPAAAARAPTTASTSVDRGSPAPGLNSAVAGSFAAPVPQAATSTRVGAPVESACSVAAVSSRRMPTALASAMLLLGAGLMRRRHRQATGKRPPPPWA